MREKKVLIFNAIINLINSIIKLCAGIVFSFSPSIADSIFSFSDFITDVLDLFELKIANKKPTNYYPFGYGRIEYISNLFVGLTIVILGIWMLFHSFNLSGINVSLWILVLLASSICLKTFSVNILEKFFKKTQSNTILMNIEESKLDILSSVVVIMVVVLSQFSDIIPSLDKSATIGSLIISLLIIKSGLDLLKENVLILMGAVDTSEEKIELIRKEIEQYKIQANSIELINYGSYYKVHLVINLKANMTIAQAKKIQIQLTKELKRMKKIKIRFVNIDLDVVQN